VALSAVVIYFTFLFLPSFFRPLFILATLQVHIMLCDREKARVARDYGAADIIRDKLLKAGITIEDRRRVNIPPEEGEEECDLFDSKNMRPSRPRAVVVASVAG